MQSRRLRLHQLSNNPETVGQMKQHHPQARLANYTLCLLLHPRGVLHKHLKSDLVYIQMAKCHQTFLQRHYGKLNPEHIRCSPKWRTLDFSH